LQYNVLNVDLSHGEISSRNTTSSKSLAWMSV